MKQRTLYFSVLFIFSFAPAFGQKDTVGKKRFFAVKTDLIFLSLNSFGAVNTAGLSLEKGFARRHSLQLTGQYMRFTGFKSTTWRLFPEYKYFIGKKKNFKGFYTGAYLKYEHETNKYPYEWNYLGVKYVITIYQEYGAGTTFGYQAYVLKHITFDFLVHYGMQYTTRQVISPADDPYQVLNQNIYPRLWYDGRIAINFGYRF